MRTSSTGPINEQEIGDLDSRGMNPGHGAQILCSLRHDDHFVTPTRAEYADLPMSRGLQRLGDGRYTVSLAGDRPREPAKPRCFLLL